MATYIYDSERALRIRMTHFEQRARRLEDGITTDEHGRTYPDPARQREWFLNEIKRMQVELASRSKFCKHAVPARHCSLCTRSLEESIS